MSNEKYEKGLQIRTQVLGEDYVNRSIQNADAFTQPLQELVTEYCWGHVWGREGLSLKDKLAEIERSFIEQALAQSDGNVSKTAKLLNLQRTTLIEKINKYELRSA